MRIFNIVIVDLFNSKLCEFVFKLKLIKQQHIKFKMLNIREKNLMNILTGYSLSLSFINICLICVQFVRMSSSRFYNSLISYGIAKSQALF